MPPWPASTLWEVTKEFKPKEYDGFKVIAMFTTEPGLSVRHPCATLPILAGMKLRAAGTGVPVLKALGAAPVGMPMPEVPQPVADPCHRRHHDLARSAEGLPPGQTLKYVTDYPTVVVTFAAVMDRKRWERLPDDVKKVIDELADEMPTWTGQYHDQRKRRRGARPGRRKNMACRSLALSAAGESRLGRQARAAGRRMGRRDEGQGPARRRVRPARA